MNSAQEAGLRGAIEAVLDSRAFAGPFGESQERSLLRDLNPVVRRFIPRGAKAVVEVHANDGPDRDAVVATVVVTVIGGAQQVRTVRLNLTPY